MKPIFLFLLAFVASLPLMAQDPAAAMKLVEKGVELHDQGDFEGAIKLYEEALEKDKDNLIAISELAMSQYMNKQLNEAIANCKRAIELHPGKEALESVFITYGNAVDEDGRTNEALDVFDQGISMFPKSSMLQFNKGVTLAKWKRPDDAITCFEKAVRLNPKHPGSHNGLGRMQIGEGKRTQALLPLLRFMVVEPTTERSQDNFGLILKLMSMGVSQNDKKNVTISIDPGLLGDTLADGSPNPTGFSTVELVLSMTSAMDFDKKNKNLSDREKFLNKLELMCSTFKESPGKGFYWEFYVPYFVDMLAQEQTETFSHIVFLTSGDQENQKWIKSHEKDIEEFYAWSSEFEWGK